MPSTVRVLVLEEDAAWRQALAQTFESILGHGGQVLTAADAASAERQLRRQPVDVLSLDLNLTGREPSAPGEPLLCDTGRLQLIELASRHRWATAVVLITRSDAEGHNRFIACDHEKLSEAMVSPDEFVRRRFSDRGLVLNKPPRWDLPTSLAHFEQLIRRRLPNLASPGYVLRFGGTAHDPRVSVELARKPVAALSGTDAMLLYALAKLMPHGEFLSDRSVVQIYRGTAGDECRSPGKACTRFAQREVDGFRRRLRKQGVNDRALVRRVRKASVDDDGTGAWRLDASVVVEGLASVNARARGGPGGPALEPA
jgi:hypothetical protein